MIKNIYKFKPHYFKQKNNINYFFKDVEPPTYEKRILIVTELLRQLKELIDNAEYNNFYHQLESINEIFNFTPDFNFINTTIKNHNVTRIVNDLKKIFPKIKGKYKSDKLILDSSLHLIVGGMIINILVWDDVQSVIWNKHYGANEFIGGEFYKHLHRHLVRLKETDYSKDMMIELNKHPIYFKEENLDLILIIYALFDNKTTMTISEMYENVKL
jgi:hypothetical protein